MTLQQEPSVTGRPLVIVGHGVCLDACAAAWRDAQPDRRIDAIALETPDGFNRNLDPLRAYPHESWQAFAILPGTGINMARLKLMMDLKMIGYKLDSFVSSRAMAPSAWRPPENSFVSDGAVIGHSVLTKYNLFVGPRCVIGHGAKLGHSVWLDTGALVGAGVTIGDNVLIGQSAILADGITIGRHCELMVAGHYRESVDEKTFYNPMFPNPVRIYGSRTKS